MSLYVYPDNVTISTLPKVYDKKSNFHMLDSGSLQSYGFYPYINDIPPYDETTDKLIKGGIINGIQQYTTQSLSTEEIEGVKLSKIAKAWNDADAHAYSGFDHNARITFLSIANNPSSSMQQLQRVSDVNVWWETIWMHYATVRTSISSGSYIEYDESVAGNCPWTIWDLLE